MGVAGCPARTSAARAPLSPSPAGDTLPPSALGSIAQGSRPGRRAQERGSPSAPRGSPGMPCGLGAPGVSK